MTIKKLLIANRGEIASRIIKSAHQMGISTVAIYTDPDANSPYVREAKEAFKLDSSYLDAKAIIEIATTANVDAIHPGYGFLSENAKFAKSLFDIGVTFIGPPENAIESMGDKITSKKIAQEAGVNTVPGHMGVIKDEDEALSISEKIGYPVMIKASAGGGGRGMRVVNKRDELWD